MSLALKVKVVNTDQVKTMRFAAQMSVSEACAQLKQKTGEGGADHGLFQPGAGKRPSRWLRMDRTLQFYDLKPDELLLYKKRHRPLKVLLVDGAQRTVMVDDSHVVGELVTTIGRKMALKNPEEFSLLTVAESGKDGAKPGRWLNQTKALCEQGVEDPSQPVMLKKKWFVTDANVTEDDPVQLHLLYAQAKDAVTNNEHPLKDDEAIQFAALQCQVEYGDYNQKITPAGFVKEKQNILLPPHMRKKASDHEKTVVCEYRKFTGMSETKAKYRYVQLIRSLRTYGMTTWECKKKPRVAGSKPEPFKLGITMKHIVWLDPKTGQIVKEVPLEHLRRWAAAPSSFTLDFGDFQDEHLTLITDDGDQMSQLIAGYIDILLKKRNEQGQLVEEDDAEVGNVENVGRIRGQAVRGTTAAVAGSAGAGRVGQAGRAGQAQRAVMSGQAGQASFQPRPFKIENLANASQAVRQMVEDSSQAGSPMNSSMSVVQWQGQLLQHSDAVGKQSAQLVSNTEAGGPGAMPDRQLLKATANQLAMHTGQMLSAAHATSGAMGGDQAVLEAGRKVAAAVADLLRAAEEVERNPKSQEARDALRAALKQLDDQRSALTAVAKGYATTDADQRLLLASAQAVAQATQDLLRSADGGAAPSMVQAAQAAVNDARALLQASRTLGPVCLDPEVRSMLRAAAERLQGQQGALLQAARQLPAGPLQEQLLAAARNVGDALAQLLAATDAAERRPTSNVQQFATRSKQLLAANQRLQDSVGQPKEILKNTKDVATASGGLVVAGKLMAKNAPSEQDKARLLEAARAVADATRRLVDDAKGASQRPQDQQAGQKMVKGSRQLAAATGQLVGDANKQAALQNLRACAKLAVADTTALASLARSGQANTGNPQLDGQLLKAAGVAAGAVQQLLQAAAQATARPDDAQAQSQLALMARQVAPQAFGLVTAAKGSGPNVRSADGKKQLLVSAKGAAESIKALLAASKEVSAASGAAEIDRALETLQSEDAALDSALFEAESGMLEPPPGATKRHALGQVGAAANKLGAATKQLTALGAGSANAPDKMGAAAQQVAKEACAVSAVARMVAAFCDQAKVSEGVLKAAKQLTSQSADLMEAARAVAAAGGDQAAAGRLLQSAKAVAQALAALTTVCNESEPGARECEQAAAAVLQAAKQLGQAAGDKAMDQGAAAAALKSATQALAGAQQQVVQAARANKSRLGAAANATARTFPDVVQAANRAAAAAPDPTARQHILQRTDQVAEALADMLRGAKLVSPDDPPSQAALQDNSRAVAAAVNDLLKLCDTAHPGQRELSTALEQVREAMDRLNGGRPSQPRSLDEVAQAAKQLETAAGNLGKAALGGGTHVQVVPAAQAAARAMQVVADGACAASSQPMTPRGGGGGGGGGASRLDAPAQRAKQAIEQLTAACESGSRPQLVQAAKSVAMACGELVSTSRTTAGKLKDQNPEAARALLSATQPVATSTSKLVQATKANAQQPSADAKDANVAAARALANNIDGLLAAAPGAGAGGSVVRAQAAGGGGGGADSEALLSAARSLAFAVSSLLQASEPVISGDAVDQGDVQGSQADVMAGVGDLLEQVRNVKPGFKELAAAIQVVEGGVSELDSAMIDADVGIMEPAEGKTLAQCQTELGPIAKAIAGDVLNMAKAVKQPEMMGAAATGAASNMSRAVDICKDAASLHPEPTTQLQPALDAAHALRHVMKALQRSAPMQEIGAAAKTASEAVVSMLKQMKGGGSGAAAFDEALAAARAAKQASQVPTANAGGNFAAVTAQLDQAAQQLQGAVQKFGQAGQTDAKGMPPAATAVAGTLGPLGQAASAVLGQIAAPGARDEVAGAARQVFDAIEAQLSQAKVLFPDPTNRAARDAFKSAGNNVLASLRMLNDALESADVGAAAVRDALDEIGALVADLDSAALFAAAGQFEDDGADGAAAGDFAAAQAALGQAAQGAKQAAGQFAQAAAGGGAADQVARTANGLSSSLQAVRANARATASQMGDVQSQSALLNAAKDLSLAIQALALAGKKSYQAPQDGAARDAVHKAAGAPVDQAVNQVIKVSQAAQAESSASAQELERARKFLADLVGKFPTPAYQGNPRATPVSVVTAAVSTAEATSSLVINCNAGGEDLIKSVKASARATADLAANAKGALKLLQGKAAEQEALGKAAVAVCQAVIQLFGATKTQSKRQSPAAQKKLSEASGAVVDRIADFVDAARALPNSEQAVKMYFSGENLEALAARALQEAATKVDAARQRVAGAAPGYQPGPLEAALDNPDVKHMMVDAGAGVADATAAVVRASLAIQKQMAAQGGDQNAFRRDPTWAKGLIASANEVAEAVGRMAGVCEKAVKTTATKDEVEAAAKAVAQTATRLTTASKQKTDAESTQQQDLAAAARSVHQATATLIAAGKAYEEYMENPDAFENTIDDNEAAIQKQIEILQLQKRIEKLQKKQQRK